MKELQKFIEQLETKAEKNYLTDRAEINIWYVIANLRKIMLHMGAKVNVKEVEETSEVEKELTELRKSYAESLNEIIKLHNEIRELRGHHEV